MTDFNDVQLGGFLDDVKSVWTKATSGIQKTAGQILQTGKDIGIDIKTPLDRDIATYVRSSATLETLRKRVSSTLTTTVHAMRYRGEVPLAVKRRGDGLALMGGKAVDQLTVAKQRYAQAILKANELVSKIRAGTATPVDYGAYQHISNLATSTAESAAANARGFLNAVEKEVMDQAGPTGWWSIVKGTATGTAQDIKDAAGRTVATTRAIGEQWKVIVPLVGLALAVNFFAPALRLGLAARRKR